MKPCAVCNLPAVKKCGRCCIQPYCSSQCQKFHWQIHRQFCSIDNPMKPIPKTITTCNVCDQPAMQQCGSCRTTRYCSPVCQKLHWKQHKPDCIQIPGGWTSRVMEKVLSEFMNAWYNHEMLVDFFLTHRHERKRGLVVIVIGHNKDPIAKYVPLEDLSQFFSNGDLIRMIQNSVNASPSRVMITAVVLPRPGIPTLATSVVSKEFPHRCTAECIQNDSTIPKVWVLQNHYLGNLIDTIYKKGAWKHRDKKKKK